MGKLLQFLCEARRQLSSFFVIHVLNPKQKEPTKKKKISCFTIYVNRNGVAVLFVPYSLVKLMFGGWFFFLPGKIFGYLVKLSERYRIQKVQRRTKGCFLLVCFWFFLTIYPQRPVYRCRQPLAGRRQKPASDPVILGWREKHLLSLNRRFALSFVRATQFPRACYGLCCIPCAAQPPALAPPVARCSREHPRATCQGTILRLHPTALSPGCIPGPLCTPRLGSRSSPASCRPWHHDGEGSAGLSG